MLNADMSKTKWNLKVSFSVAYALAGLSPLSISFLSDALGATDSSMLGTKADASLWGVKSRPWQVQPGQVREFPFVNERLRVFVRFIVQFSGWECHATGQLKGHMNLALCTPGPRISIFWCDRSLRKRIIVFVQNPYRYLIFFIFVEVLGYKPKRNTD